MAGVAFDCVGIVLLLNNLDETPGSKTIAPVVCMRMRSETVEPLNMRSSWIPTPVETSAITVLLKFP